MNNFLITSIGSFSGEEVIKIITQKCNNLVGIDINEEKNIYESSLVNFYYKSPYIVNEKEYKDLICSIIKKHNIDFIIPLTDIDVDFFIKNLKLGPILCISDPESIELCRDKMKFFNFLKDKDVKLIDSKDYNKFDNFNYPIVLKKRRGRSSEGLIKANSSFDFNKDNPDLSNYIVQPFIAGQIITCDVIRDKLNNITLSFPRVENIRTKNGAGISVTIFHDPLLESICEKVVNFLDINGAICIEFIKKDDDYFLMDINPRFSAGIAFTSLSGYNIVENHIKCFIGEKIDDKKEFKELILVKKYKEIIRYEKNND